MAMLDPMPNDLLQVLVNAGCPYPDVLVEYQQPGGPERLRQIANGYLQTIIAEQKEPIPPQGLKVS